MDTDLLLERAAQGDVSMIEPLLDSHRARLRTMIALRLDPRIALRADESDIVQEVLIEAHRRFPDYLRTRPMPFYAWLRQLAVQRLITEHRKHVRSKNRSVLREQDFQHRHGDRSAARLSQLLVQKGASPSEHVTVAEQHRRVLEGLKQLDELDREILVLRLVEELSTKETAAVLGVAEGTVGSRQYRALKRLKQHLDVGT